MEKKAGNQKIQVRKPVVTEAGMKGQMVGEAEGARKHLLGDKMLAYQVAVAWQNLLSVVALGTCFHC